MARKIPLEHVGEIMKVVLTELKNAGGQARLKDLFPKAEPKPAFNDYEREPYAKSGYIRWIRMEDIRQDLLGPFPVL